VKYYLRKLHNNLKKHLANRMLNVYIKKFEPEVVFYFLSPKLRNCQPQGCKRKEFIKKICTIKLSKETKKKRKKGHRKKKKKVFKK
jgi:hypothetical protein